MSSLPRVTLHQRSEPKTLVKGIIIGAVAASFVWAIVSLLHPGPAQAIAPRIEPSEVWDRIQAVNDGIARLEKRGVCPVTRVNDTQR